LGVGSVQSLGSWRGLINTYLQLQSLKTFVMLRDFTGWLKTSVSNLFTPGKTIDPSGTLMSRIVAEQTILYGSDLYRAGEEQFESNLNAILEKANEKDVPVILSELVSNLRDQPPFISIEDENGQSAGQDFNLARALESEGEYDKAREKYKSAKDRDALRFRAPEKFNEIINNTAKKYSCPVVPLVSNFEAVSPNGLIGNSLLLEHLHPNIEGYFQIAKAFYDTIKKNKLVSKDFPEYQITGQRNIGTTELDSVYGAMVIKHLKHSWPFQQKSEPNRFLETYKPVNMLEELALKIIKTPGYNLESGHMDLGKYYEQINNTGKAVLEYEALIASIPSEFEFYKKAATLLIREKQYDKADQILKKSLVYKEDYFAVKWIGQIALINENYEEAINYLERSDLVDQQVLFNLCRAYYLNNQREKGEEYYIKLKNMSPNSKYLPHLNKLRTLSLMKQKVGAKE
jgi:tetratricopeptide (TPR) repeat protein